MRFKKLLFITATMIMGGANSAFADTDKLPLGVDGWQKVSEIPSDVENYYFVFVDKDKDLMLGLDRTTTQTKWGGNTINGQTQPILTMHYQVGIDVSQDPSKVWTLEKENNGERFAMRNLVNYYYTLQTADNPNNYWFCYYETGTGASSLLDFHKDENSAWSFSTKLTRYLGTYNTEESPADGVEIGANEEANGQKFFVYAISKDKFAALKNKATSETPVDVSYLLKNSTMDFSIEGWEGTASAHYGGVTKWNAVNECSYDRYQTIKVPAGLYRVSVQLTENIAGTYLTEPTFSLYANEESTLSVVDNQLNGLNKDELQQQKMYEDRTYGRIYVETEVEDSGDGTGDLRIGIKGSRPGSDANNVDKNVWIIFDDFKVMYLGNPVTLDDTKAYTKPNSVTANVTLNRTLKASWNTVVLPFALNESQVTEMFGEGAQVASYTGSTSEEDGSFTLNFATVTSMEANTPYMVKPGTNPSYQVNGVVLEPASGLKTVADATNGINFVGNYEASKSLDANCYFISDNKFYQASGKETMKAYRATFTAPSTAQAAKVMNISIDGNGGTVTGINEVNATSNAQSFDVYSINGVLVKKNATNLDGLAKGIYVVNGKKYVAE